MPREPSKYSYTTKHQQFFLSFRKYDYVDVKLHKFQSKMLIKLITRLIKLYDIKKELTPNVTKIKNHGALQFLLYKNFSEKTLSK